MRSKHRFTGLTVVLCAVLCGLATAAGRGETSETAKIGRADPPAGPSAQSPRLTSAADGSALLSWMEPTSGDKDEAGGDDGPWRMRFARFVDGAWSEPRTVVERRDFFVNWADLPSVTPTRDGSLLAHWLESSGEDVYAYDVMLARSTDGGRAWADLGPAHDDGTETEHGFVSSVVTDDGVLMFWLDGRAMADDDAGHGHGHGHGHGGGDMQLRAARVRDGAIGESVVLDARVCECCATDAAMTDRGPIVVYRDRSDAEVRDISIVRRVDGRWTEPGTVHDDDWTIAGCPVNGPAVAASGERVAVAWYTMAEMRPRVYVAFSDDAGATFDAPIELDGDGALGRVDVVMRDDGDAVVTWIRTGGRSGQVRAQRVGADGPRGEAATVAEIHPGRQSGFPKIVAVPGGLLAVWTDVGPPMRLRGAVIDIE